MSQASSKINENPETQFVKCKSAEKDRTSTERDVFKIMNRKYKRNATELLTTSELPLRNKFESLSEEKCFINNDSENAEKVKYYGPRKMKRYKNSASKNQKDMKKWNEVSQSESVSQSVHKSNSAKHLQTPVDNKQNDLRFLLSKKIVDFQNSGIFRLL